jgi:hypothetical protein
MTCSDVGFIFCSPAKLCTKQASQHADMEGKAGGTSAEEKPEQMAHAGVPPTDSCMQVPREMQQQLRNASAGLILERRAPWGRVFVREIARGSAAHAAGKVRPHRALCRCEHYQCTHCLTFDQSSQIYGSCRGIVCALSQALVYGLRFHRKRLFTYSRDIYRIT